MHHIATNTLVPRKALSVVTTSHIPVCDRSNYMHHVGTIPLVENMALGVVSYYSAAGTCTCYRRCVFSSVSPIVITSHKVMFLMMLLRHYAP